MILPRALAFPAAALTPPSALSTVEPTQGAGIFSPEGRLLSSQVPSGCLSQFTPGASIVFFLRPPLPVNFLKILPGRSPRYCLVLRKCLVLASPRTYLRAVGSMSSEK